MKEVRLSRGQTANPFAGQFFCTLLQVKLQLRPDRVLEHPRDADAHLGHQSCLILSQKGKSFYICLDQSLGLDNPEKGVPPARWLSATEMDTSWGEGLQHIPDGGSVRHSSVSIIIHL